jgi:hypothetical protein
MIFDARLLGWFWLILLVLKPRKDLSEHREICRKWVVASPQFASLSMGNEWRILA